jgi:hypothetical protein
MIFPSESQRLESTHLVLLSILSLTKPCKFYLFVIINPNIVIQNIEKLFWNGEDSTNDKIRNSNVTLMK